MDAITGMVRINITTKCMGTQVFRQGELSLRSICRRVDIVLEQMPGSVTNNMTKVISLLYILASFSHLIQEVKLVGSKSCVENTHGEPSYAFGTACLTTECNKQTACWNVLSLVCTSENKRNYLIVSYQLTYRNSTCTSNPNTV